MKYYILLTVFLFGSFFVGKNILAANSDIVINEIFSPSVSTHQWIEVWNKGLVGTESVNLTTLKLWEDNTSHSISTTTNGNGMVASGEYAIICKNAGNFLTDNPLFVGQLFSADIKDLDGSEIGLKINKGSDSADFFERFSFTTSTTNFSLERVDPFLSDYTNMNWKNSLSQTGNTAGVVNSVFLTNTSSGVNITNTSTPETENNITSTTDIFDWSFIKLNEIISDPVDGNELVELFNTGSSTVDLSGGSICDSSDSGCKPLNGSIVGHDWLVADLLTDRYLNNDGDSVILKDKNNNIVDQVNYSLDNFFVIDKGQSLIRKVDGLDTNLDGDWAVTNKITLGFANELVVPVPIVNNSNGGGGSVVSHNPISTVVSASSTIKSNKISTTTKSSSTEPKDSVNISWKLDWPYGLNVGEMGIFSANGTADPRGGEVKIFWDFGDNSSSTGFLLGHTFASSGVYLVSVLASSTTGTAGKKEFKVYVGAGFSIANADVKINGWLTTSTDDSSIEYIELKNFLDKPQNISGWKIKNKSGKEYELPEKTTISASGTLKFFRSIHHLSFDKDGDKIVLTSPNDKEINKILLVAEKSKNVEKNKEVKKSAVKAVAGWLTVRGVVTVEPKTFGQQFFYISDGQTGVQIYQYKKDFPELKIGDEISVGGETSEIGGIKRIKIKNRNAIDILATNKTIEPVDLKIEDISKELLGALVKVSGDITEIKSNFMYVDDGDTEIAVYFKKGAGINKQELKEGDKVEVVGILNEGKDGWQVLPRALADLNVIGRADEVKDQGTQSVATNKYLTVTIGGLAMLLLGFLVKARGGLLVAGTKKAAVLIREIIKRG